MRAVIGKFITGPDGGFMLASRVTGARLTVSSKASQVNFPDLSAAYVYIDFSDGQGFMTTYGSWSVGFEDESLAFAYLNGVREAVGLPAVEETK